MYDFLYYSRQMQSSLQTHGQADLNNINFLFNFNWHKRIILVEKYTPYPKIVAI